MAATIYGKDVIHLEWNQPSASVKVTDRIYKAPYPVPGGVQATYLNKCVDGITGNWSFWETFFQDRTGVYYLERSTEGQQFDAATYRVGTIKYEREQ